MPRFSDLYEKVSDSLPASPRIRSLERVGSSGMRFGRLSIVVAAVTLSTLFFVFVSNYSTTPSSISSSSSGYVHLLIPANNPDPNLCKAVLSASILGYPSAKVLNWGMVFNDSRLVSGGSHIAKISGVKAYLDSLEPEHDDDLILMVDGYDVWFQLRPQTLIDRYMDINRRANERLRQDLGAGFVQKHNIKQDIIFSVQKRCWPWSEDDAPCYAVPQSSLPADVYGNLTDMDIGDERNPYIKYRPRYLNSGVAIGSASAMRALFTEALIHANKDPNFGSDQRIFSNILGEQEVWREVLRRKDMGWFRRLWWTMSGRQDSRAEMFFQPDIERSRWHNRPMEFGIGLDYEASLGLATVFAEDDTEWLTFSNRTELDAANASRNITAAESKLQLHKDISKTAPPFQTNDTASLSQKSWSDVSLFTDVYTGYTPAIIHHNAHRDGMKNLRTKWWDKIWFQAEARALMDAYMQDSTSTIAVSGGIQWQNSDAWKGGVRNDDGAWLSYEDICNGTDEEVFRDGKGPWIAQSHY